MARSDATTEATSRLGAVLAPLALAQFICSFAGSNMNVMINSISKELGTDVKGVQNAITIFLLVMAALMIPGGKLTDKFGRTRLLTIGLTVYGVGALIAALSPGLGVLILGYSLLQGIGTALLIPPVYILTTLYFTNVTSRAKAFGTISAAGGIGAAAGPLIGGLIATAISWRAAFVFQALVVAVIVLLSRHLKDPLPADPGRRFDVLGAVLSAAGLVLIVTGILAASVNGWLTVILVIAGALVLVWFFATVRAKERAGVEPLLSTKLFRSRTSNLGLVTQNLQWLMLLGTSFTVSTYLQVVRGYDSIQTGVVFTATTVGLLGSSLLAGRFAQRRTQKTLIIGGFAITAIGIAILILLVGNHPSPWAFVPGLLVVGLGLGLMLTPSVNIVQGAFPDSLQGDISGLSRSVSNLGSSLGTAIAGTILVAALNGGGYGAAMTVLMVAGVAGVVFAALLPKEAKPVRATAAAQARH